MKTSRRLTPDRIREGDVIWWTNDIQVRVAKAEQSGEEWHIWTDDADLRDFPTYVLHAEDGVRLAHRPRRTA